MIYSSESKVKTRKKGWQDTKIIPILVSLNVVFENSVTLLAVLFVPHCIAQYYFSIETCSQDQIAHLYFCWFPVHFLISYSTSPNFILPVQFNELVFLVFYERENGVIIRLFHKIDTTFTSSSTFISTCNKGCVTHFTFNVFVP